MKSETKLLAFLGVLLGIIGFIIVYAVNKKDYYAMYYAKHGIIYTILAIIIMIVGMIPIIGWIIALIAWIGLLILWVIGLIYALSEQEKVVPIITTYAKMIKL